MTETEEKGCIRCSGPNEFNYNYCPYCGRGLGEDLQKAKAEVAMEILEKIESVMFDRFSNIMLGEDIRLCIAELKKKYQEGE